MATEVGEDITDEELQVCELQTYSSYLGREGDVLLVGELCRVALQGTQSLSCITLT